MIQNVKKNFKDGNTFWQSHVCLVRTHSAKGILFHKHTFSMNDVFLKAVCFHYL